MSISAEKTASTATLETVPKSTPLPEILAIIDRDGGVIVEGMFSQEQVDQLNRDIDPHLENLQPGSRAEVEHAGDFHGAKTKRLTNLITISEVFRTKWVTDETVLGWADAMLHPVADSYWMTTAQVIQIHPGQTAQVLHRDSDNYPIFRPLGPAAPEVQINALVALTEFTEDMGATRVIPGSNKWDDFNDTGTPEMTVPAVMSPGSALLINGKVVHGGGANVTKDKVRRGLAFAFNAGFLVPEEAYPFLVPLEVAKALPPKVQNLIGFRSFHNESKAGGTLWQVNYQELADHLSL